MSSKFMLLGSKFPKEKGGAYLLDVGSAEILAEFAHNSKSSLRTTPPTETPWSRDGSSLSV